MSPSALPSMFDPRKIRKGPIHTHICIGCADYCVCRAEPDKCRIPEPYECENCQEESRNRWLETHEEQANHGRDITDTF